MINTLRNMIISILVSILIILIIGICINLDNKSLDLTERIYCDMKDIDFSNELYVTKSNDSWLKIRNIQNSENYNYIEVDLDNLNKDVILSIYYGLGENLYENKRIDYELKNNKNVISLNKGHKFDTLRFDIGSEEGIQFDIKSIKLFSNIEEKSFLLFSFIIIFLLLFILLNLI